MKYVIMTLTIIGLVGCIESNEIPDELSIDTSDDIAVLDASMRAPPCDGINQNTVFYDEPSGSFFSCIKGSWRVVDMEEKLSISSYFWTPYNAYDAPVSVSCGTLSGGIVGVITGVQSQHDNHYEDRRFSYKCSFIH